VPQLRALFSHSSAILAINTKLLHALRARFAVPPAAPLPCIGDTILEAVEHMKAYAQYAVAYGSAIEVLDELTKKNTKFVRFLSDVAASNAKCDEQSLMSFLITPIQRVPRYILLLKELRKYTSKDQRDYANLTKAQSALEELAAFINETKRVAENANDLVKLSKQLEPKIKVRQPRVPTRCVTVLTCSVATNQPTNQDLLQPHRKLIKQGTIRVYGAVKGLNQAKSRHLALCSDVLLVTKRETEFFGGSDVFYLQFFWHTGSLKSAADLNLADAGIPLDIVAGAFASSRRRPQCAMRLLTTSNAPCRLGESHSASVAGWHLCYCIQLGIRETAVARCTRPPASSLHLSRFQSLTHIIGCWVAQALAEACVAI